MVRLDQNRAQAQLAKKAGVDLTTVQNIFIYGNHSPTMFPAFAHATIGGKPAAEVINDVDSPITTPLVDGSDLIVDDAEKYSYVFEGNAQTLDHAVVNEALVNDPAITGLVVEHARINADFREGRYGDFSLPYTAENPPLYVSDHDPVRLSIGVVRPLRADLALTWATTSMSSRGAFTTIMSTSMLAWPARPVH